MNEAVSSLQLDFQNAWAGPHLPDEMLVRRWLDVALRARQAPCEVTVRIVGEAESRRLNRDYRGIDRPTNVLSFPFESPPCVDDAASLLGDLVVCAPVVEREAAAQGKPREAHYAHMVVHGALHLHGYDHASDEQASQMETRETEVLRQLGYPDPYCVVNEP